MPFGLCNAPATFSRLISLVLRGLSWKSVIVFLDDVVLLGRDFVSHMVNLSDVLRRFEQNRMKLKPKKCETSSGFSGILRTTSEPRRGASPSW